MTATPLKDIIVSDDFRKDLQEISWYLASVKQELATVRRLAIPVIVGQVNIGRKQVNVVNASGKPVGPTMASSASS